MKRKADELVSVIPELKIKKLTWDVFYGEEDQRVPKPDEYMASIGRNTNQIGSVYQIVGIREVKAMKPRRYTRYSLEVIKVPEMKEKVRYDADLNCLYIEGEIIPTPIYGIVWYSRNKKKRTKNE